MPLLSELVAKSGIDATITGDAQVMVMGLSADSRQVKPGGLFVAMPGVENDGAKFIADAVGLGAVAVMRQAVEKRETQAASATVYATDMRSSVSKIAAAFYSEQPQYNLAVTGTDGKTSTADFVRQLAWMSQFNSASIGTLGLRCSNKKLSADFPANNTSPEPILLHRTLHELSSLGVSHLAMEASSHGLDQKRMDGVRFTAAAFTNLARDHLDYHKTVDGYFAAKARLFSELLPQGATAVLNRDDARYETLHSICARRSIRVISFGQHDDATYSIQNVTPNADGLSAKLRIRGEIHSLKLPFYGAFQLSNMLAAVGLLYTTGLKEEKLLTLLPRLSGVPGRLEMVADQNGAPVFVDYAHTPAALENILKVLRQHTENKLHVVFGCGGDRDAGKRPLMGAVASQYADVVIVTDDNPRNENAEDIRAAIMETATDAHEIPDRAEAIAYAVSHIKPGDVLVIAGKGHETTQIIGNQVIHFNDAEHIRKAIVA